MSRPALFRVLAATLALVLVGLIDLASAVVAPYDRPARPGKPDVFVVSSPTRVHQFIPNAAFTLDGVAYHTNDLGFRDRNFTRAKPAGTLRIAMLGDSFVEGMGEKQEATIPKALERLLSTELARPVEVMNCGVRGGSPAVYRWWLRALSDYSLDAAVVCVFDNDMDDDACALLTKANYRAAAWYRVPRALHRSNLFSYVQGELAALRFKMNRRAISEALFNEPNFHRDHKRADHAPNAVGQDSFGFFVEPEKWQPEWKRTEEALNDVAAAARDRNIPLVVVHIPANVMFPARPGAHGPVPFKRNYLGEWLAGWAGPACVSYVDLTGPLSDWYRRAGNPPLFQTTFSHFNEQGLEKAAAWIAPAVKDKLKGT